MAITFHCHEDEHERCAGRARDGTLCQCFCHKAGNTSLCEEYSHKTGDYVTCLTMTVCARNALVNNVE